MNRLPRITGEEVIRKLSRAGFQVVRQRGSHRFLKHEAGRKTVVPVHGGDVLGPGMMTKIRNDLELTRDEFQRLLE